LDGLALHPGCRGVLRLKLTTEWQLTEVIVGVPRVTLMTDWQLTWVWYQMAMHEIVAQYICSNRLDQCPVVVPDGQNKNYYCNYNHISSASTLFANVGRLTSLA